MMTTSSTPNELRSTPRPVTAKNTGSSTSTLTVSRRSFIWLNSVTVPSRGIAAPKKNAPRIGEMPSQVV